MKNKNGKTNNQNDVNLHIKFKNFYNFDVKYELLSPIIKDFQLVSQLIKSIEINQLSDLIFIKGNNSYSLESRFYFKYRSIIDFYIKVLDYNETDCIQLKYLVYKTRPSSNNFIVNITLFNTDEETSKLSIEILLSDNASFSGKIANIIHNEFNLNFKYLVQAIKNNKQQSLHFCSTIVNSDFNALTQIIQNIKLIEYILHGKLEKIKNEYKLDDNSKEKESNIHVNDIFQINLKKKDIIYDYININNVTLNIYLIKVKGDYMIIQCKLLNNIINNNENNSKSNSLLSIIIRKLTSNSSFILIKYSWSLSLDEKLISSIRKYINKIIIKIEKLCNKANQY